MVSKKELLKRISSLEEENATLLKVNAELKEKKKSNENIEKQITMIFNSLKAINKKVNKHIKSDEKTKEENDKVKDWLQDERVDGIQDFLNKGVK